MGLQFGIAAAVKSASGMLENRGQCRARKWS
jgi:hypothetical protein